MKIAIIGNSHAGPLYTAWKEYRKQGGPLQAAFFIERSAGTEPLVLTAENGPVRQFDDMKILPEPILPVGDFDAFAVVGLGFGFHPIANLYGRVRSDSHTFDGASSLVSDACFAQTAQDILTTTKAGKVVAALRDLTDAPIALVPQPHPAEWIREFEGTTGDLYRTIEANEDAGTLLANYQSAAASLDGQVTVLNPPSTVVVDQIYTSTAFTLGDPANRNEGSGYSRGDFYHGNVAWGSVVSQLLHATFTSRC